MGNNFSNMNGTIISATQAIIYKLQYLVDEIVNALVMDLEDNAVLRSK